MPNPFRSHLSELATSLVDSILAAARSAPLEELWADPRRDRTEHHRNGVEATKAPAAPWDESRHLSGDPTAKTLELVVLLLKGQPSGLRAEQLRRKLGVAKPEITRVLKEGLATKKITKKGQRRATTYFAAAA